MTKTSPKPSLPEILPTDVAELQALVLELFSQLGSLSAQVEYLRKKLFGTSSEKISREQLLLVFGELKEAAAAAAEPAAGAEGEGDKPPPKRKGHGRRPLSKDLPRRRIEHEPAEPLKYCFNCECHKHKIGEDITEQIEYTPASITILEHVRSIWGCGCCRGEVVQAPLPPQPIEKSNAGPGLLAYVLTSKYGDHLPLYRQERILARHGLEVSRSTLCDWVLRTAWLLAALVRAMRAEILRSFVIQADETTVKVQVGKGPTHTSYLWVYIGDKDHPYTVYDYRQTRGREGPQKWLEGYRHYLQTDAYQAYEGVGVKGEVEQLGCNAHARRHFHDARTTAPAEAVHALEVWKALYEIESRARDATPDDRKALRQAESKPLLEKFKTWLDEAQMRVLPKSPIGQAIGYALSQWERLIVYLQDGRLNIDNNAAERAMRPVAVGRKNWLFAGSDRGGEALAVVASVVESAKRAGIDPQAYLTDVLTRLPAMCHKDVGQLLPDRWKLSREQETTTQTAAETDLEPEPERQLQAVN
jgi:transposase